MAACLRVSENADVIGPGENGLTGHAVAHDRSVCIA